MKGIELAKECVTKAVSEGRFGPGEELLEFIFDDDGPNTNAQFASTLLFFGVRLMKAGTVKLVLKHQPADVIHREMMNTSMQFYNEVSFYKHVLPYLDMDGGLDRDVFPKLYYGRATKGETPDKDVVIMSDLGQSGFERPRQPLYFDVEHCSATVKKLGMFHAYSYKAKAEDPVAFYSRVEELEPFFWTESMAEKFTYLPVCVRRGILPLIEKGHHVERLNAFLEKIRDPFKYVLQLLKPEEATAVIAHGDFCGNNVLFKYSEDGKPAEVRFCDLQHAKYASPAIDLAFFLCLNTDQDTKKSHWDQLLRLYHHSLSTHLPGTPVPDYETFHEEFARKAVYGYFILSYFLPVMVSSTPFDLPAFVNMSDEEKIKLMSNCGGEKATLLLSDLISFMLDKNYI